MTVHSLFHPRSVVEATLVDELAHVEAAIDRLRRAQAALLARLVSEGLDEADALGLLTDSKAYRALRRDENLYLGMLLRLTKRLEKVPQEEPTTVENEPIEMPRRDEAPRNATCPCGSGVKYKRCCLGKPRVPDAA